MPLFLTGTKMIYPLHTEKWLYPHTLVDPTDLWGILNYPTITQTLLLIAPTLLNWGQLAPQGQLLLDILGITIHIIILKNMDITFMLKC